MCVTCGCGDGQTTITRLADGKEHEHDHPHPHLHPHGHDHGHAHPHSHDGLHAHHHEHGHEHDHEHGHSHSHSHSQGHTHTHADGTTHSHGDKPAHGQGHAHQHAHDLQVPGRDTQTIALETAILGKNQMLAERNRGWLDARGVLALNLMSSPGAGKTTLLERTIVDLKNQVQINVVEGDQATVNDAQRIRATGAQAVQVNTGTGCHLEADMLERAMKLLAPASGSLLVIENVGNLVCPALFDLGEKARVVIFSVTEGEDKPLKYPHMFSVADVLLLSKIDLLPHLRVDLPLMMENARRINPRLTIFPVSAYTGEGMSAWYEWLRTELAEVVSASTRGAPAAEVHAG
jgi:hydrogenase nickel incorporation protein HypB